MEDAGRNNHGAATLTMMKQFHTEGKYCDVQLQVNTKVFKSQRSLLAANSEYFDTMFSSNFQESNAVPADQPIILHEMDLATFEVIFRFLYTGDVQVNDTNVLQLLLMDDFLGLRTARVKEQCVDYIKSRCSEEKKPMSNTLELFSFACMKAEIIIVDILSAHVCQHLYHFSMDVQLKEIGFESLNALLKFSKNYILPLPGSQNVVLKIIHYWVNHNREDRSKYRRELMENIDSSNISSDFTLLLINKLESFIDKLVNLSRNIKSPHPGGLETLIEIDDLPSDDAQFHATITFDAKNVSKMKIGEGHFSPITIIISNLSWKIYFKRASTTHVSLSLYCDGPPRTSKWKCWTRATYILASQKEEIDSFEIVTYRIFSSQSKHWGVSDFFVWNDLINPEKGYITDDDSVTFRILIHADVPFY